MPSQSAQIARAREAQAAAAASRKPKPAAESPVEPEAPIGPAIPTPRERAKSTKRSLIQLRQLFDEADTLSSTNTYGGLLTREAVEGAITRFGDKIDPSAANRFRRAFDESTLRQDELIGVDQAEMRRMRLMRMRKALGF